MQGKYLYFQGRFLMLKAGIVIYLQKTTTLYFYISQLSESLQFHKRPKQGKQLKEGFLLS
tara:strand:- start:3618 stop:3797 length:180 start_codon:yes stop_codon:yes gene_type:complete